jgi:hypothetical protein
MKKIVFVCDGNNFSKEAFKFVEALYENEPFLLTGAFFHSIDYALLIPNTFAATATSFLAYQEDENEAYQGGITQFRRLCERNNIEYRIHEESEIWKIEDLVKETRFADLVVIGGSQFFSGVDKDEAKAVLQETLHRSECPIIVIPDNVEPIEEVIFAYDGKRDSLYALKQFIYLFPCLCQLETTIVYCNENSDKEIPDLAFIEEFAARHFRSLTFEHLKTSKKAFSYWTEAHQNAILITGAYNRSSISMAFNKSFAQDVITKNKMPVFISHL